MNVLFLTLYSFYDINRKNIYTDLMRRFLKDGHHVYVVSPVERRKGEATSVIDGKDYHLLKVRTGNQSNVSLLEKGISTVMVGAQFLHAIRKHFKGVHFDLILYSTPPITLANVVKKLKKRNKAKTYLMLKDIFPQNAVDLGMMPNHGLVYNYFRRREKRLYDISDFIGCMSKANVDYVRKHNDESLNGKLGICPNSMDPTPFIHLSNEERKELRKEYYIPENDIVLLYGGNLGKPQGIDFLLKCLEACKYISGVFFVLIGSGNEYGKIDDFCRTKDVKNVALIPELPKDVYERLVGAFDIGLVFLDHRFTIPNYPSRILSYMNSGLPILAATDPNTDVGVDIVTGGFGWWCESDNVTSFRECVENAITCNLHVMGEIGRSYMERNFSTDVAYQSIMQCMKTQHYL